MPAGAVERAPFTAMSVGGLMVAADRGNDGAKRELGLGPTEPGSGYKGFPRNGPASAETVSAINAI
jgi:hypothetical protein